MQAWVTSPGLRGEADGPLGRETLSWSWVAFGSACLLPMAVVGCGGLVGDVAPSAPGDAGIQSTHSASSASADGVDAAKASTFVDAGVNAPDGSDGSPDRGSVPSDAGADGAGSDSAAFPGAVDPSVSAHWSWQECGSIAPTPPMTQGGFLPSGELVVSYVDGSILVYSAGTWRPVRQLAGANVTASTSTSFGVSLDGALLATASAQSAQVMLLSTADGSDVLDLVQPPECAGGALQFSAEGDYVFETGGDSTCIWQTADGSLVAELPGPLFSTAIRMAQLVTVDNDASVEPTGQPALLTYTLPTGACAAPCPPPVQGPSILLDVPSGWFVYTTELRISPRGDSVAGQALAMGSTGSALWSADGSLAYSSFSQLAQGSPTVYSPAGERVLLTDRVVNVATSAVESVLTQQAAYDNYVAIDSTGQRAASLSLSGTVALFDLASGEPLDVLGAIPIPTASYGFPLYDMAASSDGTHLLVGTTLWRIDSDFVESNIVSAQGRGIRIDDAFSPDGTEYVVSGDLFDGIESTDTGALLEYPGPPPPNVLLGPDCFVTGARLSPHNDWFLVGAYQSFYSVNVLNIDDNTEVVRLPTTRCSARAVFNADETLVVTTDPALYRVSDWSTVWNSASVDDTASGGGFWDDVQIRPNANEILVSHCGTAGCLHALYSLTDGSMLSTLPELTSNRAKFSPEGNWVVSGATLLHLPDGQQRVLDPAPFLATFVPNGDVIALLADNTLARYCRAP
jgi:WD40 repeat protein